MKLFAINLKIKCFGKITAEGRRSSIEEAIFMSILIILIFSSNFLTFFGYSSYSQTLYAHAETTAIGGSSYYLHSLSSADGNGTALSASAVTAGRRLMGR